MLRALDAGLQNHGIKLVALMRLSLVIPYNVFNYVMGTTRITLFDFMIGSIPMIFLTAVYIFIGCGLNDISDMINGRYHGTTAYKTVLIVGIIVAVILIIVLILVTRH